MCKRKLFRLLTLVAVVFMILPAAIAVAAPPVQEGGKTYTVQKDDWLSKIAEKEYGDVMAYPAIVYYNNLKALEDSAFTHIADPDLLEVGWSIYLPTPEEATAYLSRERGELIIGLAELPPNADPQKSLAPPISIPYPAFSDPLIRENFETGELVPALATSWKRIDDTTLEVNLRRGVKFHNGEPFDANAVKFSFERALNPDLALAVIARVRNIAEVEVIDDYTVRIVASAPDPLLEKRLTVVNIVPPKYVTEVGDEEFSIHPIGTGAFKFVSHVPQQEMVFEAWDEGWRGPPELDRLIIRPVPDDAARVTALLAGDIDIAYGIPPDQIEAVEAAGFKVIPNIKGYVSEVRIKYIDCNCPLEDPRVRQALNYAVDKEAIVETLFRGKTEVVPGQHALPFAFGYNPDLDAYPYDPDKARALLAEAGYPDGFDTTFQTTDGRALLDKEVSEVIVAYLADVGVRAEMKVIDSAQYVASFHDPTIREPLGVGWWLYVPLDADFFLTWMQCSEQRKFFCDPEFDEAYHQSQKEMDPGKREKLLQKAIEVMHDNPPTIFLFANPDIYGLSATVAGFTPRPDGAIWFDDLKVTR